MMIIAHRGACKKAPENSLAAIKQAFVEGAQRIELDLQLSKDRKIYVCHDDLTARTTSHSLLISQTLSEKLQEVHLENGESLPTLLEVLKYLQKPQLAHISLNCEIKSAGEHIISPLADLLESTGFAKHRLIVSSFSSQCLAAFAASKLANIKRAYLWKNKNPTPSSTSSKHDLEHIHHALKTSQTHILHPQATHYTQELARAARIYNLEVYSWAQFYCNELQYHCHLWETLLQLGVDGHCTNYPLELKRFLRHKEIHT